MQRENYSFRETNLFSGLFCDFVENDSKLEPFKSPLIEELDLKDFVISEEIRIDLCDVIKDQANGIELSSKSKYNLNLLKEENTYTVTTGHQLNIAGGPLFFTYKILSTIRACQELSKQNPNSNFVPIYWAATEDHDFEEINHFFLFGKKILWEKDYSKIPVGNIKLDDFNVFIDQWGEIPDSIKEVYRSSETLAEAHNKLVYDLFGTYGLLTLDANDVRLKKHFVSIAQRELNEAFVSKNVSQTNNEFERVGYKPQVTPRMCNLFHIEGDTRSRLDVVDGQVIFVDSDRTINVDDYISEIANDPTVISPNVLMRPLYQQVILPNVAYVGGPGEIAYWLQLKEMFSDASVSFPALVPRFFGLYVPKFIQKKLDKSGFVTEDLFRDVDSIKKEILGSDIEGQNLLSELENEFSSYQESVIKSLDKQENSSLKSYAEAALTRMNKENQNILKKVKKDIEGQNSVKIDRVVSVLSYLFQDGIPQERRESVFTYSINNPDFIDQVYKVVNPFQYCYNVLKDA